MDIVKAVTESFVKVLNLIQREPAYTSQVDATDKYIPYFDGNDNFPVELSNLVKGSPTATSCLSTLSDFITGEGFNLGADLENKVMNNQGLTFGQFHGVQSDSFAHDWGVASLIKYNRTGGITEVYDLQFSNCRLGEPDSKGIISKIKYNPYFGTGLYRRTDTKEFDVYNPKFAAEQAASDKRWKGQIFWFGVRSKKHPFYPVPDYYTARYWMNVEKNAGIYFDEQLEKGFLQDIAIKIKGNPNEPSGMKNEAGEDIPNGKAFSDEMTKNFGRGAKTRHKMVVLWADNKDEYPEIVAMPTSNNPDLFRVQDDHATKKITIATKVPAILANISEGVSLGGDGNTIRAAVKLMQQRVKRPQNILITYYQEILKNMVVPVTEPITIVPYNPYPELETIDPLVWAEMTPEERRKWIQDHTEIELDEAAPAPQPAQTTQTPAENRISRENGKLSSIKNLHFDSYPSKAKENVKRALDWQTKMGIRCLGASGQEISNMILDGKPIGPRDIGRLSRYLSKNILHKDRTYDESCDAIKYDAWGGVDMMKWANERVKELKGIKYEAD